MTTRSGWRLLLLAPLALLAACEYSVSGCGGQLCVGGSGGGSEPACEDGECSCPDSDVVDREMLREVTLVRRLYLSCPGSDRPDFPNMSFDHTLDDAATAHARDMARYRFESLTGSDGLGVGERVARYAEPGFSLDARLAQLVASDVGGAREAVDEWLRSGADCATLLSAHYSHLGAACERGGDGRTRWSLVLGGS